LKAYTRNTLSDAAQLLRELELVRRQGFAFDNEEAELGVRCIGAGVRDDSGMLIAGLSVSAPAERMRPHWAEAVRETADRISRAVGYRPSEVSACG